MFTSPEPAALPVPASLAGALTAGVVVVASGSSDEVRIISAG
jgi:hypothetical protein